MTYVVCSERSKIQWVTTTLNLLSSARCQSKKSSERTTTSPLSLSLSLSPPFSPEIGNRHHSLRLLTYLLPLTKRPCIPSVSLVSSQSTAQFITIRGNTSKNEHTAARHFHSFEELITLHRFFR
mmetsp:Transcript_9015/g.19041  ORF Transcript_9015/g.19041 Transcript_9015/m.19041 type:complete len:124 (-) Transcript_9015:147-518(-)